MTRKTLSTRPNVHDIVRIPPLPYGFVLTDRADGTLWFLSHTVADPGPDGNGYITITDTIPEATPDMDLKVFPAEDGPIVDSDPLFRMLIRGGRLGMELVEPSSQGSAYSRREKFIQTRKGVTRLTRHIHQPTLPSSDWLPLTYILAWTPETLRIYPE